MSTILKIASLIAANPGDTQEFSVEVPVYQDHEIELLPGQILNFTAYRIEDGIVLINEETELKAKAQCVVTLQDFILEYPTLELERQYYWNLPEGLEDADVEMIDKKYSEIDTDALIREIVFLSLPPVIKSPAAEELSQQTKLEKSIAKEQGQHPFANLKDLLDS